MGIGSTFGEAFAKAQLGAGNAVPLTGTAFLSVRDADKPGLVALARDLSERGYRIVATRGTAAAIQAAGTDCLVVNKVLEGRPHIVDMIKNSQIDLIVNTTEGKQAIADSFDIRRAAVQHKVSYSTTLAGARATCMALEYLDTATVNSLQSLHQGADRMSKVPITARGAEKLREELVRLKTIDRPRIIQAIAEARAHGDLKENAEYHAAREQQSFAEGRIKEIEGKLSHAHIVDVSTLDAGGKVVFGSTVELSDEDTGESVTYQIVGEDEADIKSGKISINSPIARALIAKMEGDVVTVRVPSGERSLEIVEVRYI